MERGQILSKLNWFYNLELNQVDLKEMGENPSKLGDVISPIVGSIAGKVISLGGLDRVLKANILIENKAMQDYRTMIASLKESPYDAELIKILEHNLVDEDLHTAWFKERLEGMGIFTSKKPG